MMHSSKQNTLNKKTVVVGMSGGVDSSVSAILLKEQGYNVIGMFMKNWEETDQNGDCHSAKDFADVVAVCEKIDIPYYSVEFIEEYQSLVFSHFVAEYKAGYTPNPDILCNREIKFKVFLQYALNLGADFLATGHYCQTSDLEGERRLVKGVDPDKDQTYFLYTLKSEILEKVLFPIGHMKKREVRELAQKYNLPTKDKKDSMGICFIGKRNFKNFLSKYIPAKQGDFCTLDGRVVGIHQGSCFYTIGQRKGLGLGGPGGPWFVIKKDTAKNIVYVERGELHPALYSSGLTATEISWIGETFPKMPLHCTAKIRYRQIEEECLVETLADDRLIVTFKRPQRAIAPRQSIVFYTQISGNEICLGGAMIEKSDATFFERGLPLPATINYHH